MQHMVMQLLGKARALQAQGNLASAVREYEAATLASGHHPAVAFELISAQLSAGQPDAAVRAAKQVAERHPRDARVRLMYAQVLAETGKHLRAVSEIETARKLDPRMPEAPAIEGALRAVLGDHARSETCFREALKLQPGHAGLLTNLGHALKAQGKFEEALEPYRQALAGGMAVATATACADLLTRIGRTSEGIPILEQALATSGNDANAHHMLGNLLEDDGRLEEAANHQRRALALQPDFADAAHNLGSIEAQRERWDEACSAFERAIAVNPASADAHEQLILAFQAKRDYAGAVKAAEAAVRLTQKDEFRMRRGHMLCTVDRYDDAIEEYKSVAKARAAAPDDLYWDARLHIAAASLAKGDLAAGWAEYVHRKDRRARGRRDPRVVLDPMRFFREPPGTSTRILLDKEQGIGDQLFFLRFARSAGEYLRGAKIAVGPKLRPLLRRIGGPYEVVEEADEADDCTVQMWVSDLALAAPATYVPPLALTPDPRLVEEVRAQLARCGPPPYVGVTWRAGVKMVETNDRTRRLAKELDVADLAQVLSGCGATVIGLQRGLLPGEGEAFAARLGRDAFDFTGYSDDLERMLALLSLLDDYLTVSNTNVHLLAGLPFRSARILSPFPPEWRWYPGGRESPWFPGMTVYRALPVGNWTAALEALEKDCRAQYSGVESSGSERWVPVVAERRYSAQVPSPRYLELMNLYRRMHTEGDANYGIAAQDMFPGKSLPSQALRIKHLIARSGARTILDYGSGKGLQYQGRDVEVPGVGRVASIKDFWGVDEVRCYDPGYPPFSELPTGGFDGVICTDVLEHCPEEDLEWIVAQLFSLATRFVFANVASYPALKVLPNGENAHITQRGASFWEEVFRRAGRPHPQVDWEVQVAMVAPGHGMVHKPLRRRG